MRKLNFRPRAVIFDMDGVLVDSMPYHFLAWYEALRPLGIRVGCFDVYAKEGERWDKTLKGFLKKAGREPSKRARVEIFRLRQRIFKKYFRRFIFKGAEEFLRCLDGKGYLLGLVTGTPTAELNQILPKRILGMFDCVVAGDDVKKGKPHPDPYLKAAKCLRLEPRGCIVVENAPFGIESAKKAGMFCIAVTTSLPRQYLGQADCIVDDLTEITGLIEGACSYRPGKTWR